MRLSTRSDQDPSVTVPAACGRACATVQCSTRTHLALAFTRCCSTPVRPPRSSGPLPAVPTRPHAPANLRVGVCWAVGPDLIDLINKSASLGLVNASSGRTTQDTQPSLAQTCGRRVQVRNPHKLSLPGQQGQLTVSFVDLTPVPVTAVAMSSPRFSALRSIVLNSRVRISPPNSAGQSAPTLGITLSCSGVFVQSSSYN